MDERERSLESEAKVQVSVFLLAYTNSEYKPQTDAVLFTITMQAHLWDWHVSVVHTHAVAVEVGRQGGWLGGWLGARAGGWAGGWAPGRVGRQGG